MVSFDKTEGFQWDDGNKNKNTGKHQISNIEAEQIFFNEPLFITDDTGHSTLREKRFSALGKTDGKRNLTVVFTLRGNLIRIISARQMSKRERKIYNEEAKKNT